MKLSELDPSLGIGLFTDGSSWAQDKSGGWAWLAIDCFGGECHGSGKASGTTNNRMELSSWIEGLNAVHQAHGPCEIVVFSDSEYVGLGAMNRYRNRIKNLDLWQLLDAAIDQHIYVEFNHVRGHSGNPYNEKVDKLASKARRGH
jgi:ribonuclease HI